MFQDVWLDVNSHSVVDYLPLTSCTSVLFLKSSIHQLDSFSVYQGSYMNNNQIYGVS